MKLMSALLKLRQREDVRPMPASIAARIRRRRGMMGDEGATLVETAISISIILMLIFGVFDMSLCFYTYHYVSDAAREGSRWAMVRGSLSCTQTPNLSDCGASTDQVAAFVKGLSYPGIDSADYMKVNTTWLCAGTLTGATGQSWSTGNCGTTGQNAPGNQVQVQVTYNFPLSVPFAILRTLRVTSTSSMVISQ